MSENQKNNTGKANTSGTKNIGKAKKMRYLGKDILFFELKGKKIKIKKGDIIPVEICSKWAELDERKARKEVIEVDNNR